MIASDANTFTGSSSTSGIPMTSFSRLAVFAFFLLIGAGAFAHQGSHHPDNEKRATRILGHIDFPTTTQSTEAQAAFIGGMQLLHLFEYDFAELQFRRAHEIDPGFVMAYWGEAMVHNHPIWDDQDADKAHAVLNKLGATAEARAAKTDSQKEKDYLESLEILYGTGPKVDRDRAYMRYLEEMARRYPDDHEVRLLYALSIMGTSAGVRDIPSYIESTSLSQSVFYANREHPGAAHYLIHGVDDPVHAPLGLEAARALAVIAPDAGHSLHMTSHIFTALGMWDDVVVANINAAEVSNSMAMEVGKPPRHWGHYNFWLLYGLLQQGRVVDARTLLFNAYEETNAAGVVAEDKLLLDPDSSQVGSLVQMWARYMIETRGSDSEVALWRFNMGDAYDPNLNYHYVNGLLSAEPDVIAAHLSTFRSLRAQLHEDVLSLPRQAPYDLLYLDRLVVIEHQLEATLERASGDTGNALKHAREASRLEGEMPYSFGPPFVDFPSAQMLGELSLDTGDNDAAAAAFAEQLLRSRLKVQALLGLARAERARGDSAAADYAMALYQGVRDKADNKSRQ
jgi:hypothetical protein